MTTKEKKRVFTLVVELAGPDDASWLETWADEFANAAQAIAQAKKWADHFSSQAQVVDWYAIDEEAGECLP